VVFRELAILSLFCWICRLERTDSLNFWQLTRWESPAIVDEDFKLWESGAILHLAQSMTICQLLWSNKPRSASGFCLPTPRWGRNFVEGEAGNAHLLNPLNQILGGNFY